MRWRGEVRSHLPSLRWGLIVPRPRTISHEGAVLSLSGWARREGITRQAMWVRLSRWGSPVLPPQDAPRRQEKATGRPALQVQIGGVSRTRKEWAVALGMTYDNFTAALRSGAIRPDP